MKIFTCALLFFATISAYGQDVPPPPRPDGVDPALAPLLESLKRTLLSSWRVDTQYYMNVRNYKFWRRITSVVADSSGCQARVHFDSSSNDGDPVDVATSVFLELIDKVETLTQQEAYDRARSRLGQPSQITYSGDVYVLLINGTTLFLFQNKAQASQAATAVDRAAQICRTEPIALNTAAGAPGLAETLQFIAEKMNDTGAVNYRSMYQKPDGTTLALGSYSKRLTQSAGDLSNCLLRVNERDSYTSADASRRHR